MQQKDFSEVVDLIRREDARFGKGAYSFVHLAVDFTLRRREDQEGEPSTRHVRGPELLDGIREYALEQYGPLSLTVLNHWNIRRCRDFGEIVFQLVEYGMLGKTEDDRLEDFSGGYDFDEAFDAPFRPQRATRRDPEESSRSRE